MTNAQSLQSAVSEWASVIGGDHVSAEADAEVNACTTGASRHVTCVLRPGSAGEVRQVVEIANRWRLALYPIATGRNWGYGSANPVQDGCVIVDLARLDGIYDFDPELGVVTIEPGVTQESLRTFLDEAGADYLVPVTGAGPTCSILANALERGYGITPFCDHFAAVTALEAVLPDGRVYRTPLSELGGAEVDRLFKWGVGPYLDGLFTQGNFGIVTRMTITLAAAPESTSAFFFSASDAALERVIPAIRRVLSKLHGTIPAINLLNRQRMLSMITRFPDADAEDGVLPPTAVERLSRENGIYAWNGVGAIYATRETARGVRRLLRRELGPHVKRLVFVDAKRLRFGRGVARLLPGRIGNRIDTLAKTLQASLDVMNGRPSEVALPLAYWRSGQRPEDGEPMDPARDGCGLIWYAPLVPMRAEAVRRYLEMVERLCPEYGINPLITLTTVTERCFDSTVPLLFDRSDERAQARTHACYRALVQAGQHEGFVPYRLNIDAMDLLEDADSTHTALAGQLKEAIDPEHLVAPGRYVPSAAGAHPE